MDYQSLKIKVIGKVQNVGFRYNAKKVASSLQLVGLVRNEPDGSVYIEVEGSRVAVNMFLKWCSDGPKQAAIENVLSKSQSPVGYTGFKII
jgi:acylphosphatase